MTNAVNDMIYDEFKKLERHNKKGVILFKAGKRPKHESEDPIGIDMGIDEKNVYNVTVQNGQDIIANNNSTVTATTHIGVNANELEWLIVAVRTKMDTLTDTETASESLEVIEAEIVSEKPKNP